MTRRASSRWASVVFLATLVLASCARSNTAAPIATGGTYGSGVDLDGLDGKKKPSEDKTGVGALKDGSRTGPAGVAPAPARRSAATARWPVQSYDKETLGLNAAPYLRANSALPNPGGTRIAIEVNAVKGHEPRKSSLDLLVSRVKEVAQKPVTLLPIKTFEARSADEYSMSEIRQTEAQVRKQYSDKYGDPMVMHVLYLNGSAEGSISVVATPLGIAYAASSVVVFPDEINDLPSTVPHEIVESAVLVHEIGHLLALVNIGYESPRNHDDGGNHSSNTRSVMYAAVERVDVAAVFENDIVPTRYDADDLADLADIRAARIKPYAR